MNTGDIRQRLETASKYHVGDIVNQMLKDMSWLLNETAIVRLALGYACTEMASGASDQHAASKEKLDYYLARAREHLSKVGGESHSKPSTTRPGGMPPSGLLNRRNPSGWADIGD